jgi:hypothetical protein
LVWAKAVFNYSIVPRPKGRGYKLPRLQIATTLNCHNLKLPRPLGRGSKKIANNNWALAQTKGITLIKKEKIIFVIEWIKQM